MNDGSDKLYKNFAKNSFYIYLLTYITAPFGYFIRILYTKNFSLSEFGMFYSIIGFYSILSILCDIGFSNTFSYFGPKFYEKKEYSKLKSLLYYSVIIQIISSLIFGILIFVFSGYIAKYYFKDLASVKMLYVLAVYFLFLNVSKPFHNFFLVKLNMFLNLLYTLLYLVLIFALSFFYIYFFDGTSIYIIGVIWGIVFAFMTLLYIFLIFFSFSEVFAKGTFFFEKSFFNQIFNYAFYSALSIGAILFLQKIDTQVITFFLGFEDVGLYEISMSIANVIVVLFAPIQRLIFPLTSKLFESCKNELENIVSNVYSFLFYVTLPCVVFFSIFAKDIVAVLYDPKYFHSTLLIAILSSSALIQVFFNMNYSVLAGLNKIKERNIVLILGGIMNLLLNILFVLIFGLNGIAFATFISSFAIFLLSYVELNRNALKLKLKNIKSIIFANIVFTLILLFSNFFVPPFNILLRMIIIFIPAFLIYLIIGFILKVYDIKLIKTLFNIKVKKNDK